MGLYCYADNLLTESVIVPSSMTPVQNPSHIEKFAAGSATMTLQGVYTDTINRDYLILISYADNVVGIYRYDWSDTGGVSWNQVNVTIVPNVFQTLNNGLQIMFAAGPYTPQLLVGDRFRFHMERPYRPAFAVDLNRENELRSGAIGAGGTWTVTCPFASATAPQAGIIFDLTAASTTTIRLQASTTSNFAATPYNQVVSWSGTKVRHRLPAGTIYPYWRWHFTVVGATPYLGMSGLYLGSELVFSQEMDIGMEIVDDLMGSSDESILARGQGRYGLKPKRWAMTFSHRSQTNDLALFETLLTLTRPKNTRSLRPFYLVFDSVPGLEIFELVHLLGSVRQQHEWLERTTPRADMLQVVRTAA